MTPAQLDLARRLVAHPKFRWVEGMLAQEAGNTAAGRVTSYLPSAPGGPKIAVARGVMGADEEWYCADALPDLSDYATAAILLRMAMEAQEPEAVAGRLAYYSPALWNVGVEENPEPTDLGTVAATALLAAWG